MSELINALDSARRRHVARRPLPTGARIGSTGVLLVAVLVAAVLPPARAASDAVIREPAPTGKVVDGQGSPVAGARVLLYFVDNYWGLGNRVVQEVVSDSRGRFTMTEPLVYRDGNGTTRTDHYILFAAHPQHALAWHVIVSGAGLIEYSLVLTEPAAQSFKVTDAEGRPLEGARVWLSVAGNPRDVYRPFRNYFTVPQDLSLFTATTDAQGRAVMTNLPRTGCAVRVSLPGYSLGYEFVEVPAWEEMGVQLARGVCVSGCVLTEDGRPVVGADVWFSADWASLRAYAITDAQGRFVRDDLQAHGSAPPGTSDDGQYRVTIRHPDYTAQEEVVRLEPGQTIDNLTLRAVEGTLLRIRVLEPETDRPIQGAEITGHVGRTSGSSQSYGYTDADGMVERRVPNDLVSLSFSSPPRGTYVADNQGRPSPEVQARGGIQDVTLYASSELHRTTTITCRVVMPDGSPVAGLKVDWLMNLPWRPIFGDDYRPCEPTDRDGRLEVLRMPADAEVLLYGHTADYAYVLAEVVNPATAGGALAGPLVMQPGRTPVVTFTDYAGKPRANLELKIRPAAWGNWLGEEYERTATTDAQGRLSLNGIVSGQTYDVRDARYDVSSWDRARYYRDSIVLLPGDGRAARVAIPMPATGRIAGKVVDLSGKPIAGATAILDNRDVLLMPYSVTMDGQSLRAIRDNFAITDSNGVFEFAHLNPGTTEVTVRAAGYRTQILENVAVDTEALNVSLDKPRAFTLSGVVVDSQGEPLSGAGVTLVQDLDVPSSDAWAPRTSSAAVRTDEAGRFRFDERLQPLGGRSWTRLLLARKEGYGLWGRKLDSTGGEEVVRIVLTPQDQVSGTVTDDAGTPIPGATVLVGGSLGWDRDRWWSIPGLERQFAPQVQTGADGRFTLGYLPTASAVTLEVSTAGYAQDHRTVATKDLEPFAIREGHGFTRMSGIPEAAAVQFRLQRAVTLRGTVVYEGEGMRADRIRLAVQARDGSGWSETVTDKAGRFEMTDVRPVPCSLLVLVNGPACDVMPDWTAPAVQLDELKPGEVRDDLKIVLTRGGIVRGKVTDAQDHPLKGICVASYSAARPREGAACQSIDTADNGTWVLRFPPGEVYVYIGVHLANGSWLPRDRTCNLIAGQVIDGVDFKLNQVLPEDSIHRVRPSPAK